jgi:hypothetical protein
MAAKSDSRYRRGTVPAHFAYWRSQPAEWTADNGVPEPAGRINEAIEVICVGCGDHGGPIEWQTPEVQRRRGPYLTVDDAKTAIALHVQDPGG